MKHSYVPIDRIFAKLSSSLGSEWNEDDVIDWTGEALEFMGTVKSYEEAVAFIEVKNHQCILPPFLHAVVQVARNNRYSKSTCTPKTVADNLDDCKVTTSGINPCVCPPADAVWLDCQGKPIVAYELAYYRPYFDLQAEFYGWSNSRYHKANFSPVRLSNNIFFNSLVCREKDSSIYTTCRDEYTIVSKSHLRFSFQEGQVAVAYLRQVRDLETGYPLIPDNISHITAITNYIRLQIAERDLDRGRQGAEGRVARAEQNWQWYCGQSVCSDMMPYGIDDHQDLLDQRSYMLPDNNNYYSFFGNLNTPENKWWNINR